MSLSLSLSLGWLVGHNLERASMLLWEHLFQHIFSYSEATRNILSREARTTEIIGKGLSGKLLCLQGVQKMRLGPAEII